MTWCETECKKKYAIGEQNVMKLEVFILGNKELIRRERKDGGEGKERGLGKGAERG